MNNWRLSFVVKTLYFYLQEKVVIKFDCKECKTETVWYLTILLDPNTGNKNFVWWCSFCSDTIYEDIGPFVPN